MKTRLDPPQTPDESTSLGRIQRDARGLTEKQIAGSVSDIITDLGDAITRERRQAVAEALAEALAEMEPELQRLRLIEKTALAVAVEDAMGDDEPATLESISAMRDALGQDVVEAAVFAFSAGLDESALG